jgi:hypothetical protein
MKYCTALGCERRMTQVQERVNLTELNDHGRRAGYYLGVVREQRPSVFRRFKSETKWKTHASVYIIFHIKGTIKLENPP